MSCSTTEGSGDVPALMAPPLSRESTRATTASVAILISAMARKICSVANVAASARSRNGNDVGSCHADDDGDRASILVGSQTPTKKRTMTCHAVVICAHGCGGYPYWHPAAPRGPSLDLVTSCFRSWTGPVLVQSGRGPVLVRAWSGPGRVLVRTGQLRSSGRSRPHPTTTRSCGATAPVYGSAAETPGGSEPPPPPKGRVGGPNATTTIMRSQGGIASATTILRPRSQGDIAPGVTIVRHHRRQRRDRRAASTTVPRPNILRGGKTHPICPLAEGFGVDPEGPQALPSKGPH